MQPCECRRSGCRSWMNRFAWYCIIKEVYLNVMKRKTVYYHTKTYQQLQPSNSRYSWQSPVLPCRRIPGCHPTCRLVHRLRHSCDPAELHWHSCFAACLANFNSRHMWRLSAPLRQQGKNRRRPTGMAAQLRKATTVEKNNKKPTVVPQSWARPSDGRPQQCFLAEKDRGCAQKWLVRLTFFFTMAH